ncbi:VOC family protein [Heyndrickxia acidicola]|uniref:VOC family protein n=1 Tax=Heyndrickxia acidicola TaxID=209389 RepID=A0ABU6MLD6_9BACI|nr:VOC family protein [Heyndrickxia acidicola]MED1205496.1 VOC family protein [Heyndrickxia acidicola]
MGRVIGFELNSQDPEKAAAFYSNVFGWKMTEPQWEYWPAATGEENNTGIDGGISRGPSDFPHGTRIHIEVESMEDAISKAVINGARIVSEIMEFDDFFLAYLVDPVGLGIGLVQKKQDE